MGRKRTVGITAGVFVVALLGVGAWWRRRPSACPYGLRLSLDVPHPFLTRSGLKQILAPQPGERVLEVGPGTGYYSLEMARWISPDGTLDVLDVQQEMLDLTARRARERGMSNVVPRRGEALPDLHMVPFESLRRRAEASGLRFERRKGGQAGYYARFSA